MEVLNIRLYISSQCLPKAYLPKLYPNYAYKPIRWESDTSNITKISKDPYDIQSFDSQINLYARLQYNAVD